MHSMVGRTLVPEHVCDAIGWEEGLLLRHELGACLVHPSIEARAAGGPSQLQLEAFLIGSHVVEQGHSLAQALHKALEAFRARSRPLGGPTWD